MATATMDLQQSLAAFNADVRTWANTVPPERLLLAHRKLALEALSRVVKRTPVDTGRARGNWQASIESEVDAEIPAAVAEKRGAGAITAEALTVTKALQPYGVVFIQNNVPYILPLEDGHSAQARAGMVRPTVLELRQSLFQ